MSGTKTLHERFLRAATHEAIGKLSIGHGDELLKRSDNDLVYRLAVEEDLYRETMRTNLSICCHLAIDKMCYTR